MTLWERVKEFYSKRKYEPSPMEIEFLRQQLKWRKARLSIRQIPEYPLFKEWLESLIFSHLKLALILDEREIIDLRENMAKVSILDRILDEIEGTTLEQIAIDERNLKKLEEKAK